MAYRELEIIPDNIEKPLLQGGVMFVAYIIGGSIPVLPYLFLPIDQAVKFSVLFTLLGLFVLGSLTTRFTKRKWWKAGFEMLILASLAASVGYFVGQIAGIFLK